MVRRGLILFSLALVGSSGCAYWDEWVAGTNKYGSSRNVPVLIPDKLPPASTAAASRVDSIGSKILAANPDIGLRPMFFAAGRSDLGIFHSGRTLIVVSEGVVNQCKTDGELAAVLCWELGKMVEEANLRGPVTNPERDGAALSGLQIGNDTVGGGGDPTFTGRAEQALIEKNPRTPGGAINPAQTPDVLSRQYLCKTGFTADDLGRVTPLLHQAEANPNFEKQLTTMSSAGAAAPNSR